MDPLALALRILVAAVLAVAGAAKLADLRGSRDSLREFGMGAGLARIGALALPLAELAVAICLAVPALARPGAIVATVLFVSMSTAIVRKLAVGQSPDCHCFGRLHPEPVGKATLARVWGLVLASGFVALYGAGSSLGGAEAAVPVAAAAGALALALRAAEPRPLAD